VILTLDIPDEALAASPLPKVDWENEARKELALAFYARGLLSAGKATEWSGVSRMEFEQWIAERKIVRPLSVSDFDEDQAWAQSA
jgi:predicted HTH domain antitoxin